MLNYFFHCTCHKPVFLWCFLLSSIAPGISRFSCSLRSNDLLTVTVCLAFSTMNGALFFLCNKILDLHKNSAILSSTSNVRVDTISEQIRKQAKKKRETHVRHLGRLNAVEEYQRKILPIPYSPGFRGPQISTSTGRYCSAQFSTPWHDALRPSDGSCLSKERV